jgi:hypothetical protein
MLTVEKMILTLAGIALLLSSCSKEDADEAVIIPESVEAIFTPRSQEATRATATSWEAGDLVGIFALKEGMPLSTDAVYDGKANIAYENSVDGPIGLFSAAINPIRFPADGSAIDFVAYYPYTTAVSSDYQLPIDLSQQSPLSAIDLMYATATGQTKANPSVSLTFTHSLSRFELTLTTDEGVLLDGASLTIDNVLTKGSMDLATGTITAGTTTGSITPVTSTDAATNSVTASAILLPGQQTDALTVHILLADGKQYHWKPPVVTLLPGKSYSYSLNLTAGIPGADESAISSADANLLSSH